MCVCVSVCVRVCLCVRVCVCACVCQIQFVATRGSGFRSDIAIDDVAFASACCMTYGECCGCCCMLFAWCLHGVCAVCMVSAWCLHGVCMVSACCLHGVCMLSAWYLLVLYSVAVRISRFKKNLERGVAFRAGRPHSEICEKRFSRNMFSCECGTWCVLCRCFSSWLPRSVLSLASRCA